MTVLEQLPLGAHVCVIRLRSLGDCVLTTPALTLLNQWRPDLKIGVSVEERFAPVLAGSDVISTIVAPSWLAVRRWKPQLCVNLHGGTRSQWMTALSGAKWRAGFAHHSMTFAYNVKIGRAQPILGVNRTVHTAEHLAAAFFALGVPVQEVPRARLHADGADVQPPQKTYAVLHPFAAAPQKRWAAERFCEIARYLELWNITPVFLAASDDDALPFTAHTVFRGGLSKVKTLLANAALFLGNDSGPAHIAAAFGIPSVVLFGPSNPSIWGPWQTESEIVVAPDGLDRVSVSRVIAALEKLSVLEGAHA